MNKRALFYGLIYCIAAILFKLIIVLGDYTAGNFGFYYSHFVSVLLIIPFFFFAVYQVREKELNGFIRGREAFRISLTIIAVAAIIMTLYNYIEFNWKLKEVAVQYYNSNEFLEILKKQQAKYPAKMKTEDFPKIISEQLSDLSAFKATTGKLIPLIFIGVSGAFICAVFMKKTTKQ